MRLGTKLLVLTSAALIAGCGAAEEETPAVASPPDGALEIDGEIYPMGLGTHCWRADQDAAFLCVDAIGIVTAPPPYGQTSPGAAVALAGELAAAGIPIASAQLWPAPEEPVETGVDWEAWQPAEVGVVELVTTAATLPLPDDLEPGPHLLAVNVHEEETGNSATYGAIVVIG